MTEDEHKTKKYNPGDVVELERNAPGFCDKETHFMWVDSDGKELPAEDNRDLKDIELLRAIKSNSPADKSENSQQE